MPSTMFNSTTMVLLFIIGSSLLHQISPVSASRISPVLARNSAERRIAEQLADCERMGKNLCNTDPHPEYIENLINQAIERDPEVLADFLQMKEELKLEEQRSQALLHNRLRRQANSSTARNSTVTLNSNSSSQSGSRMESSGSEETDKNDWATSCDEEKEKTEMNGDWHIEMLNTTLCCERTRLSEPFAYSKSNDGWTRRASTPKYPQRAAFVITECVREREPCAADIRRGGSALRTRCATRWRTHAIYEYDYDNAQIYKRDIALPGGCYCQIVPSPSSFASPA